MKCTSMRDWWGPFGARARHRWACAEGFAFWAHARPERKWTSRGADSPATRFGLRPEAPCFRSQDEYEAALAADSATRLETPESQWTSWTTRQRGDIRILLDDVGDELFTANFHKTTTKP